MRAFALDVARHLSIFGKHPAFLARPDSWASWRFDAIRKGRMLIRTYRPDVIWSTYPTPTAHVVGARLSRRFRLPWIADFRDPMSEQGYPEDARLWKRYREIEEMTLGQAVYSVFTAPGAAKMYRHRYPDLTRRITVVENGYDEETFREIERSPDLRRPLNAGAITLLHSGVVYPSERDPAALFAVLGKLKAEGLIDSSSFRVRFRAPGHASLLRRLSSTNRIDDIVEILPPVGYHEALCEMMRADALLVMQAESCNRQIPAKVYEYLRAGRPIIGLTERDSDTAAVLAAAGISVVASLTSEREIYDLLSRFAKPAFRATLCPNRSAVECASRLARTGELAQLLDSVRQVGATEQKRWAKE